METSISPSHIYTQLCKTFGTIAGENFMNFLDVYKTVQIHASSFSSLSFKILSSRIILTRESKLTVTTCPLSLEIFEKNWGYIFTSVFSITMYN